MVMRGLAGPGLRSTFHWYGINLNFGYNKISRAPAALHGTSLSPNCRHGSPANTTQCPNWISRHRGKLRKKARSRRSPENRREKKVKEETTTRLKMKNEDNEEAYVHLGVISCPTGYSGGRRDIKDYSAEADHHLDGSPTHSASRLNHQWPTKELFIPHGGTVRYTHSGWPSLAQRKPFKEGAPSASNCWR